MAASIHSEEDLQIAFQGKKFVEGACGWLFLTSDSNDQIAQQFGFQKWTKQQILHARKVIVERKNIIPSYMKYIIPEKSIVYREYLPMFLRDMEDCEERPCLMLDGTEYLLDCLKQAKPMGALYFRGDTHPNWLGSYILYAEICRKQNLEPLSLDKFSVTLAGFDGDLFAHMTAEEQQDFLGRVPHFAHTLDVTPRLQISQPSSIHVGDGGYDGFSRETLVHEHVDKSLPKAVIFRDSTAQFMVPWIAEHFSRSVFVWHRGDVIASVIEREQPDIVFQIMAERFVWQYRKRSALT